MDGLLITADGTAIAITICADCRALTLTDDEQAHQDWHERARVGAIISDGQQAGDHPTVAHHDHGQQ